MNRFGYSEKLFYHTMVQTWHTNYSDLIPKNITEMCFSDENYDYDSMTDSTFLGAYDGDKWVGLAILQPGFFKYMYLYDLKFAPL